MIRREELDKLLQLLNAGIIGPESNDFDGPVKRLYGMETFVFNFKYDTNNIDIINGNPPKNFNNSIDKDLSLIIETLDKVNIVQGLKIGKNSVRYKWKIKFYGLDLNIEETLLDTANIDNTNIGYLGNIEDINQYLISEFNKISSFIKDPKVYDTIPSTTISFQEFSTIDWYYNQFKEHYNELIVGDCKIQFKYFIDIFSEKI